MRTRRQAYGLHGHSDKKQVSAFTTWFLLDTIVTKVVLGKPRFSADDSTKTLK